MKPHLEVLPPAQRAFWDEHARSVPEGWVLYGGTAIALRYGHRSSVDFDFFSDRELDEDALRRTVLPLRDGAVFARRSNTLTVAAPVGGGEVRLSFFGMIGFGRVGLSLNQGVSAALALFPDQLNPLDVAKAVGWFEEGDLDAQLPAGVKDFLTATSVSFHPEVHAMKLAARKLEPGAAA